MTARYQAEQSVAIITLDAPPVNGLGYDTRAGVAAGIDRALADPEIKAIVIAGAGRMFSAGADIREFNTPKAKAEPTLNSLISIIESSDKPVIAAIGGGCMGGGLELAMGCHFRIAANEASIALPEVKLGILPGAGGTQRLPRAVGLEAALNMIVSGTTVRASQLAGTALFDELVEGDPLPAALSLARKVAQENRTRKRLRDLTIDDPNAEAFLQFARNTVGAASKGYPAPLKCVEAVAAAVTQPFKEGKRIERELFAQLMRTPESRALRHAFFAERTAARIPGIADDAPARQIRRVAVIGAGTMGCGIAMNFVSAGLPVTILETKQGALDKGLATIRRNYESSVKRGKLDANAAQRNMALLSPTLDFEQLADSDLVIEAVFEDMEVKQDVFRRLDRVAKPGAILASNTSTLDLDRIAATTERPQDVIGMHFFSPANV
ncbi:MAG: 3-hydroxyacyl-CoA dehydrogenase, partial [Betaproteobacteria bacterium]